MPVSGRQRLRKGIVESPCLCPASGDRTPLHEKARFNVTCRHTCLNGCFMLFSTAVGVVVAVEAVGGSASSIRRKAEEEEGP